MKDEDKIEEQESQENTPSEKMTFATGGPAEMGYHAFFAWINGAWEEENRSEYRYSHIREIYGDHIIVATGYGTSANCYKIPYTIDGEKVEFDVENRQKVQLKTEWVAKATDFNPYAVKSLGEDRIGAFAIVFGDEDRRDVDDQWFEKSTEGYFDIFKAIGKLPWLFDHAFDGKLKSTVIGEIDVLEMVDDVGIWYEAKILEHDLYKKYVSKLINAKALFSSSGALPLGAKAEKSGRITRWPIAEISGTHHPADHRQVLEGYHVEELKAFYKSIGINSDDLFKQEDDVEQNVQEHDAEEAAEMLDAELIALEKDWLDLQKLTL